MNLPNKLTIARIIIVPFFVAALLVGFPLNFGAALLLFIAASVTDLLDGKIARKKDLVTDFGKFADPLADKILVLSAFLCFVQLGLCDCVAVIIVLFREFSVTSIRLIAAKKGSVVAANMWGKAKTVSQMVAIIGIMAMNLFLQLPAVSAAAAESIEPIFIAAGEIMIWISVILTVISGVIYIVGNRRFISQI